MRTKRLVICALFTAMLCITAPFYVMLGPVPITLTMYALALCAFSTGSMCAAASTAVYIFIGLAGMPVFSAFKGGFGAITSPTGGFILSYIFVALILGMCVKIKHRGIIALLCALALMVCYLFGTLWYVLVTRADIVTALMVCTVPFIPFDAAKLAAAYALSKAVRKQLKMQM